MGNAGVVVVDTNSHHEETLRSLDPIADSAVVPYGYSWAALDPTLRTINALTVLTIVLPHQRSTPVGPSDTERLDQVAKKADHVSSAVLTYNEKYTRYDIPDSTAEYDQLVSEQDDFAAGKDEADDTALQLNTRISRKHRKLLAKLSRGTGKTIRSLVEESLEDTYA